MKKIFLIDWNSFIYRMFYALPEFATKDWKIVNATFWMAKFFTETLVKQNPDYLIFVKDAKWENFRHKLYADYKATRDRMPDNLKTQIWDIEELVEKLKIDTIEIDWVEADDVIWTLANNLWKNNENDIYILSGDKDLYSLINKNVSVFDTMKKKVFREKETLEKFWVEPKYIIDYLSIVWDSSDNIPWIAGFWPKKAVDLIKEIWSIEQIFQEVEKVSSKEKDFKDFPKNIASCFKWKTFEKLENSKEDAFLSKKLATIELNVELEWFDLENYKFKPEDFKNEEAIKFFKDFEFNSLLSDWDIVKAKVWWNLGLKVQIIDNKEKLDKLFEKIKKSEKITLDTETTSLDIMQAKLVWVGILLDEKNIFYINRLHSWDFISKADLQDFLEKILNLDILIIWHNLKYDLEIIEMFLNNKQDENQKNKKESLSQIWLF